jgi:putative addiction module component (TIGR02574 family)
MAKTTLSNVRTAALELDAPERAELAQELLSSLDGAPDTGVAEAWDEELSRRLDEVEAGTARSVDRAEFRRLMQERLRRL